MKLQNKIERSAAIICACAALHNIACAQNEPCPEDTTSVAGDDPVVQATWPDNYLGTQIRQRLIRNVFAVVRDEDLPGE